MWLLNSVSSETTFITMVKVEVEGHKVFMSESFYEAHHSH